MFQVPAPSSSVSATERAEAHDAITGKSGITNILSAIGPVNREKRIGHY